MRVDLVIRVDHLPTRLDRIATFLAVLEMMRLQLIVAFQRAVGGEVRIARSADVAPAEGGAPS